MEVVVKLMLSCCLISLMSLVSWMANGGTMPRLERATVALGITSFTLGIVLLIAMIWQA